MKSFLPAFLVFAVPLASSRLTAQDTTGVPSEPTIVIRPSAYWGYSWSPYGDVIRATGDFLIKQQESRLLREQVRRAKLVTRKLELEHVTWERDWHYQDWLHRRDIARKSALEAALDQETGNIFTGTSLNELRRYLIEHGDDAGRGSAPIPPGVLDHVQLTTVQHEGRCTGLLKGAALAWPYLLRLDDFTDNREQADVLFTKIRQSTRAGRLPTTRDMEHLLRALHGLDDQYVAFLRASYDRPTRSGSDFYLARRFLNDLRGSVEMLKEDPKALEIYSGPLPGQTVGELVAYMQKEGLLFAKAMRGDERFYQGLHAAMVEEVNRLRSPGERKP
jgi:hypothetical protein